MPSLPGGQDEGIVTARIGAPAANGTVDTRDLERSIEDVNGVLRRGIPRARNGMYEGAGFVKGLLQVFFLVGLV